MALDGLDLYEFPADHIGRKSYVSVRGHSRSIPKYKTYRGTGGFNYLLPEYGGDWSGLPNDTAFIMPDKAGYLSPLDGKYVEGRNSHRDHMKRHNVLEAGDLRIGEFAGIERAPMPSAKFDIRRAISELQ
jgi:hypothetical protein